MVAVKCEFFSERCERSERFCPDEHTVALYHFDEGEGDVAHDACGDDALTLRAKLPLWAPGPDGKAAASFARRDDDANLFVGPADNDKLHLRTCCREWTIEACVRYTGPLDTDGPHTYAAICATDEEGFMLPHGIRGGWNLSLLTASRDGLVPWSRWIGKSGRSNSGAYIGDSKLVAVHGDYHGESDLTITDENWHHVAWQFRYADQTHYLFLDGVLIWKMQRPYGCELINDVQNVCVPFMVGGMLHSQDPPFYLQHGLWQGDICEVRISDVMRYPVAGTLAIIRSTLPDAMLKAPYHAELSAEKADGDVTWQIVDGELPAGLSMAADGVISGQTGPEAEEAVFRMRASDGACSDEHAFTLKARCGSVVDAEIPSAFVGMAFEHTFTTELLAGSVKWSIVDGGLPAGMRLDADTGVLSGTPEGVSHNKFSIVATDSHGQVANREITVHTFPAELRHIAADDHTVVLYDWQGPSGRYIKDVKGDDELTLTWCNMIADQRQPRAGWGRYPTFPGGGEYGFTGPQHNDKLDLRTCKSAWTVEAWVKRGGASNHYCQPFDFGHVCGTYDTSRRGVWELYIAYDGTPDGGMAPGVNFFDASGRSLLADLHPWKRGGGKTPEADSVSINDTQWHHIAWQYSYDTDTHELFLDGVKIWQMALPGDVGAGEGDSAKRLVNDRKHDAQFSVGSRIGGFARYGGDFNWLGWGNFFGQIGEIRISDIRRYE